VSPPEARIVRADEWLAVIEKPPGLVVHAAPGHRGPTLVDLLGGLLAGGEDPQRPGIVHRLDKDTSGLMVVARGADAHRRLARLIKARQVRRSYLALVEGHPRSRTGTIDAPLGRDYRAPERRAVGGRAPRDARTHFKVLELLAEDAVEAASDRAHHRSAPTSRRSAIRWRRPAQEADGTACPASPAHAELIRHRSRTRMSFAPSRRTLAEPGSPGVDRPTAPSHSVGIRPRRCSRRGREQPPVVRVIDSRTGRPSCVPPA
jgi:hypothetical protein